MARSLGFFDKLTAEHEALGQEIDFSDLKSKLDTWFLFDLNNHLHKELGQKIFSAGDRFKRSVQDDPKYTGANYKEFKAKMDKIQLGYMGARFQAAEQNIAKKNLEHIQWARKSLKDEFGVEVDLEDDKLRQLEVVAKAFDNRPVKVTEELLQIINPK